MKFAQEQKKICVILENIQGYQMLENFHLYRRLRMSIRQLEEDQNKSRRYAFLKAWHNIKNLDSSSKDSFWSIASINGQPFDIPRTTPPQSDRVWGGYSQHLNVLFPTWYRCYLLHLEVALTACVDESEAHLVALHYWDETSAESLQNGLPQLLIQERVQIDDNGNTILNPLIGFTLPKSIPLAVSETHYAKPNGYTTKRYPYSGLVDAHDQFKDLEGTRVQNDYINKRFRDPITYLQENIKWYLNVGETKSIKAMYANCLAIESYNEFSNKLSAGENYTSIEETSDSMLLALGGKSIEGSQHGLIAGANGDIGAKGMAAFDPLFFLHMSNVDRIFWTWQGRHDKQTIGSPFTITSNSDDQGCKPKYGQGPTPTQQGDVELLMGTPLNPFHKSDGDGDVLTSNDCVHIEIQLNYTYTQGSG